MCTGRVDMAFVLRAFQKGADGVIIGGCWPGECHYITEGNYDALGNMYLTKRLLSHVGVDPERLRLEWIAASEGSRFAEVMSDFAEKLRGLGPLMPEAEDDQRAFAQTFAALQQVVPYIKLVEREKFRIPEKSEEAYRTFYESEETNALFDELVGDKLVTSRILTLLQERPLSAAEISARLSLAPGVVARHMNDSSRLGLVRFDFAEKCYALAMVTS